MKNIVRQTENEMYLPVKKFFKKMFAHTLVF